MSYIPIIQSKLETIQDFRKARGQRYKLYNLLTISILAVLAGADDFGAMAEFAKSKKHFLHQHQLLKNNRFPSHDIFRWIFMNLDKKSYAAYLSSWLQAATEASDCTDENNSKADAIALNRDAPKKMIHIDGKSIRATRTSKHSRTALQIVSAFCSNHQLTLGQLIIDNKSCEKTAIPQLLDLLYLKNSVVTIDAVATTKKVAAKIVGKKGDYILALKKNNRHLYYEVESFFTHFKDTILVSHPFQTTDKKHGRSEIRTAYIISDLNYIADTQGWEGLKSIVVIESQRTVHTLKGDKIAYFTRFYLSSLESNAPMLMKQIRQHWTVENQLHWLLDVAFNEDKSRLKHKLAAANFAATRRFALGLMKCANISKQSIKNQRLKAAWDNEFLDKLFHIIK